MRNTILVWFAWLDRGPDQFTTAPCLCWGKDEQELQFQVNFNSGGFPYTHVKDDDPFYLPGKRWVVLDKGTILAFMQVVGQATPVIPQWALGPDGLPTVDSPWNQPSEWPVSDGKRATGGKTGRGNNPFEQIIIVIGRIFDQSARKPRLRQELLALLNDIANGLVTPADALVRLGNLIRLYG